MPSSNGTHGTFRSNLGSILKTNMINVTSRGRIGWGAYFWKESPFQKELAIAWVRFKREKERSRANETEGVVFYCSCSYSPTTFLDIEAEEYKSAILSIGINSGRNLKDPKDISWIHDEFIRTIESQNNIKIEVIQGRTSPPREVYFVNCKKYPVELIGNPLCLAVRNPNCVIIRKHEVFKIE